MDDEYDYERELEHDPDDDEPPPPGDEDAPLELEQPGEIRETVQEAIGYMVRAANHPRAQEGRQEPRGAPIPDPEQPRRPGNVCAVCNKTYAIRSFGECPHCQGDKNRRVNDAMRDVIRELKDGRCSADRERHLVKQLYELGHPNVKDFLGALTQKREAATSGVKPRRGA